MRASVELKNIPISLSILHECEYHNLRSLLHIQPMKRRRAATDRRITKVHPEITVSRDLQVANIQMFRSGVGV
jgi:hypothetical protein